jgi:hypothetical protein
MLQVEFFNKSAEGERSLFRVESEKSALDFLRLVKETDAVFHNGQLYKYRECSFDLSSSNLFMDTLSIGVEEIG